jgi:hypothetical protein
MAPARNEPIASTASSPLGPAGLFLDMEATLYFNKTIVAYTVMWISA